MNGRSRSCLTPAPLKGMVADRFARDLGRPTSPWTAARRNPRGLHPRGSRLAQAAPLAASRGGGAAETDDLCGYCFYLFAREYVLPRGVVGYLCELKVNPGSFHSKWPTGAPPPATRKAGGCGWDRLSYRSRDYRQIAALASGYGKGPALHPPAARLQGGNGKVTTSIEQVYPAVRHLTA